MVTANRFWSQIFGVAFSNTAIHRRHRCRVLHDPRRGHLNRVRRSHEACYQLQGDVSATALGGGSMTAIPIVETQEGDVSGLFMACMHVCCGVN